MSQETTPPAEDSIKPGKVIVLSIDEDDTKRLTELCCEKLGHDVLDSDFVSIGGNDTRLKYPAQQLIYFFRKYNLHDNDRQTVLSHENSMNVMQLCLAEQNKKKFGSFEVEASAVISAMQSLREHKSGNREKANDELDDIIEDYEKYLKNSNTLDLWDVLNRVTAALPGNESLQKEMTSTDYLICKLPPAKIQQDILSGLLQGHALQLALVEVPLSDEEQIESSDINISYENLEKIEDAYKRAPPSTCPVKGKRSVTEAYAEKVIMGYLELLVNTRSEIALARIIDIPCRELDHKAFTNLKHAARPKNMSMYQTAVSHVMRIRLGGKSYAPGNENLLSQHTKGLSELVDLVHKLQNIVEEEKDTVRSLKRVLSIIKNAVVTHRENTLRKQSVEAVTEELQEKAEEMKKFVESKTTQSPPKTIGQGGSMLGRATLKVIRFLLDSFASQPMEGNVLDCMSDTFSSQHTPVRFPSIFAQFRSPLEASPECLSRKTLASRISQKFKPRPKNGQVVPRFQSAMDWAMPIHDAGFREEEQFSISDFVPNKTIAHPAANTILPKVIRKTTTPAESCMDQENLNNLFSLNQETLANLEQSKEDTSKSQNKSQNKAPSKPQKRTAADPAGSQAKKSKKATAPKQSKKKGLTMSKGQTQLTTFFR